MADATGLKILVVGPGAIGGITAAFLARAGRVLAEGSRIVSLQNGIVEDIIAGIAGTERTVGFVVGWASRSNPWPGWTSPRSSPAATSWAT
jgi:glycine/D-amino acid oxidase-like deaminating enzyme